MSSSFLDKVNSRVLSLHGDVACEGSSHACPRKSLFSVREAQVTDALRSNGTRPNQTKDIATEFASFTKYGLRPANLIKIV